MKQPVNIPWREKHVYPNSCTFCFFPDFLDRLKCHLKLICGYVTVEDESALPVAAVSRLLAATVSGCGTASQLIFHRLCLIALQAMNLWCVLRNNSTDATVILEMTTGCLSSFLSSFCGERSGVFAVLVIHYLALETNVATKWARV